MYNELEKSEEKGEKLTLIIIRLSAALREREDQQVELEHATANAKRDHAATCRALQETEEFKAELESQMMELIEQNEASLLHGVILSPAHLRTIHICFVRTPSCHPNQFALFCSQELEREIMEDDLSLKVKEVYEKKLRQSDKAAEQSQMRCTRRELMIWVKEMKIQKLKREMDRLHHLHSEKEGQMNAKLSAEISAKENAKKDLSSVVAEWGGDMMRFQENLGTHDDEEEEDNEDSEEELLLNLEKSKPHKSATVPRSAGDISEMELENEAMMEEITNLRAEVISLKHAKGRGGSGGGSIEVPGSDPEMRDKERKLEKELSKAKSGLQEKNTELAEMQQKLILMEREATLAEISHSEAVERLKAEARRAEAASETEKREVEEEMAALKSKEREYKTLIETLQVGRAAAESVHDDARIARLTADLSVLQRESELKERQMKAYLEEKHLTQTQTLTLTLTLSP